MTIIVIQQYDDVYTFRTKKEIKECVDLIFQNETLRRNCYDFLVRFDTKQIRYYIDPTEGCKLCELGKMFEQITSGVGKATILTYPSNAELFVNDLYYFIPFDGLEFDNQAEFDDWANEVLSPCCGCENYDDIKMSLFVRLSNRIK